MGSSDRPVPGPPRDLVGYGQDVPSVRWPGDANVAINFVVNYEEGSEYSYPSGDGTNEKFATSHRSRCTSTAVVLGSGDS